jgi:hypothetical protein
LGTSPPAQVRRRDSWCLKWLGYLWPCRHKGAHPAKCTFTRFSKYSKRINHGSGGCNSAGEINNAWKIVNDPRHELKMIMDSLPSPSVSQSLVPAAPRCFSDTSPKQLFRFESSIAVVS